MTGPAIDPERVAALLDGRLDARARDALLAELARDDDAMEQFADVVALVREMERLERDDAAAGASDAEVEPSAGGSGDAAQAPGALALVGAPSPDFTPAPILPGRSDRPRRRGWRPAWVGVAAAAVLTIAVVGTSGRWRTPAGPADPAAYVALLGARAPDRSATEPFVWSGTRGAGDPLTLPARAVRFGARATELELARRAGDRDGARRAAAEAATLLAGVAGAAPIAETYRRASVDSAPPSELRSAWTTSVALLGADGVRAGAWLAAARAAAARRDAAFFRGAASRQVAQALARQVAGDTNLAEVVRPIERAVTADEPVAWDALGRSVDTMLAGLGR